MCFVCLSDCLLYSSEIVKLFVRSVCSWMVTIAEALFVETISHERSGLVSCSVIPDHMALLWDCSFTYYSAC